MEPVIARASWSKSSPRVRGHPSMRGAHQVNRRRESAVIPDGGLPTAVPLDEVDR